MGFSPHFRPTDADPKKKSPIKPFLKWAGGKRWFIANFQNLIPKNYNRYLEPFLGSGAVFFHIKPKEAILGDLNKDLIETYLSIRNNWKEVLRLLHLHQKRHSEKYYYELREAIPKRRSEKAARFIYLNKTCWNGLYRVNQKGKFNVPIGDRTKIVFEKIDLSNISKALKKTDLRTCDFEKVIGDAKRGDFLFVDPPYTVCHNNNGFIKYNEKLFSWNDQKRLFEALLKAKSKGAKILATNANHIDLVKLYKNEFGIKKINRISRIAGKTSSRNSFEEIIIFSQ